MPLHVAFQMDSIESIDINADTTFRMMEEAQARGHQLFYYLPDMLSYQQGRITARGCPITLRRKARCAFCFGRYARGGFGQARRDLAAPRSAF